jgi:endonuclease/exonuclease/phosphatase family metal-dependent hydrolase
MTALIFLRPFALVLALLAALPLTAQQTTRIRVVSSNLSSGNNQRYEGPGTRLLKAMNGDVILMNEFKVEGSLSTWVSTTFGPEFQYYVEPTANIPNGVVSRYPILASGVFADPAVGDRNFAWARIDIPGSRDLWAISVHLKAGGGSDATTRNAQAGTIINNMLPSLAIPATDYIALGADFNAQNRNEAFLTTLRSRFTITAPYPVDQNGNGNTNANRNNPYDWVVANQNLHALETPVVYGTFSFPNGFVLDSRTFSQTQLNNTFPGSGLLVADSGATGMQHMGVVRDFLIPSDGTGGANFTVAPTSVDFGTGLDVAAGPFLNSSVQLTVTSPFSITGLSITGPDAAQFAVVSPSLATLPTAINANTPIQFRWTPTANDAVTRTATATFTTNGSPSQFAIQLSGATRDGTTTPGGEGPVYFFEDFEATNLTTSYTSGTFTAATGTWAMLSVLRENASESCAGSAAARINDDTAGAFIRTPALTQGAGTLQFRYRELNSGGGTITVSRATDPAGPWTLVGTIPFSGTSCQTASLPVRQTGTLYLRIMNDNHPGHLIIDDVSVTSFTEAPPPPPAGWVVR